MTTWSSCLCPQETVAPVGSEVVLVAAWRLGRIPTHQSHWKWTIAQGSVGQFVSIGRLASPTSCWVDFNRPHKVDNSFRYRQPRCEPTSAQSRRLLTPRRRVTCGGGEGWISLTSPVEGTSNVPCSPRGYAWTSGSSRPMVHMGRCSWQFPASAINQAGTKHVFTTTVTRQSNTRLAKDGGCVRDRRGAACRFSPSGARRWKCPWIHRTGPCRNL